MTTAQPVRPPLPAAIALPAPPSNPFATILLVVYTFLIISRVQEFLVFWGVGRLRLVLVTSALGLILALPAGGLFRALKSPPGIYLMLFTGWLMMATPTSLWRGGSARMLKDEWAASLIVFFVVAGLSATFGQLRKAVLTIACATLVAGLLTSWLGRFMGGRFAFGLGTFQNANLLTFHLLFGAPLCVYWLRESRMLLRVLLTVALGLLTYTMLLTGSRGGLVILVLLMLMMLVRFSWFNRVKVVLAAIVLAGGLYWVPRQVLNRYQAIVLSKDDVESPELASALESREARVIHLRESLEFTLQHPLFGVGPGLFSVASADYAKSQGRKPMWRETHNAYTQVSSECGIPALIFFLGLLIWTRRAITRVDRAARVAGEHRIENLAFCLKMSLTAFVVYGLFDSVAYQYYLPLLAGLALMLERSTRPMLVRESAAEAAAPVTGSAGTLPRMDPVRRSLAATSSLPFARNPGAKFRPTSAPASRTGTRRTS